jgi:flagellar biosynthesis chaperone FliJ
MKSITTQATRTQTHQLTEPAPPEQQQSGSDAKSPQAALTVIDPEKLRATLTRLAQERDDLQQRVSAAQLVIKELRSNLGTEHVARLQLEEKLTDVMSAGIQFARNELSATPKDALDKQLQTLQSQLREKTAELERARTDLAALNQKERR